MALCFSCALKMSELKAFPFLWTIGAAKEPFQCVRSIVQRLRRICAIDSNSIKEAITSSAPVIPILKTPLSDWFFICLSRNPCCCGNSETNAESLIETVTELPVPGFSQDGYGQDRKKAETNKEFKDVNWTTGIKSVRMLLQLWNTYQTFLGIDYFLIFINYSRSNPWLSSFLENL